MSAKDSRDRARERTVDGGTTRHTDVDRGFRTRPGDLGRARKRAPDADRVPDQDQSDASEKSLVSASIDLLLSSVVSSRRRQ
jgi:hypothetical protein